MDISVFSSMLSVTAKMERKREGKKLRQYLAAISATIGPFAVGTVLAWTSPVLPQLKSNATTLPGPHLDENQASWVGSIIAIGAIFGSLPASQGANYIGRKAAIGLLSIPFLISWLMIIFAKNVMTLYISRFIAGGVIGAITGTVPMYIGEIAETSIRGELGSYIQLMVTLGILYVYVIGPFVTYFWLNVLCAIIPVIFGVLFMAVAPETPLYLLRRGRRKDAEKSLLILRGDEYDIYTELEEIQEQINDEKRRQQSFTLLFTSRAVVRATIAVMGLLSFLSFSGINVLIFYAEEIFAASASNIIDSNTNAANISDPNIDSSNVSVSKISAIIIGVMQVVMTYFSGLLVDRAGRRILLLVSDSIMALCLLVLGFFFWCKEHNYNVDDLGWVPLVSLSIYISVFALGFGPIPGIMMGELFSSEVKGMALGIVCILASVLEFFVVKGFSDLVETFQMGITFWIFAFNCLLGTFFVYFLVPETKNKSMQQIQDELNGKRKIRKNVGRPIQEMRT